MPNSSLDPAAELWIRRLVAELLEDARLAALVEYCTSQILRDVPEMDAPVLRDALNDSTTALARTFLPGLSAPATLVELPEESYQLALAIAQSGLDLKILLRVYRSGQQAVTQYLSAEVHASTLDAEQAHRVVMHIVQRATEIAGMGIEVSSDAFVHEHDYDPAGAFARRRETVRAILAGARVDQAGAEGRLGYQLNGWHVAYILWADEPATSLPTRLERTARQYAGLLRATAAFILPAGNQTVWAWARTGLPFSPDQLRDAQPESGVRVAFGAADSGLAGFRHSHIEALAAQRTARRCGATVTCYSEVEVEHLLSGDDLAARRFVERHLAPLAGTEDQAIRLRETLHTYLRCLCSIEATARELGVHRNTVRYRIDHLERTLGYPIGQRRLELELALRYAAMFGDE